MSKPTQITLETLIPFSTADFHYTNHRAVDVATGEVYAYQSVAFPAWHVDVYLAVCDAALGTLLSTGLPAIPDFPSLLLTEPDRAAFTLTAWNCVKIGIPREVIERRAENAPDTPQTEKVTLQQMQAFLESDGGVL